ncbi:MAG: hypothetical protein KJ053_11715 [Dehalococcoidia bacterium]|nr:hypothetical protein [Dehalococcoidia bacterium]
MVAGNVVEDRAPGGAWVPGGPSLYSARAAAALGARVTLITRLSPGFDRTTLEGLDLRPIPATSLPRYANTYDAAGNRTQLLLCPGEPLDAHLSLDAPADALIVAPAYHEFDALPVVPAHLLAVSYQGILRTADGQGRVLHTPGPASATLPFSAPGSFAFFSEEDTADPEGLAQALAGRGVTVFLTRGPQGATLFRHGEITSFPAVPASANDPTGAGDCFAAAFVVRFVETRSVEKATLFALAAAALSVEGEGLASVPARAQVESRLARVAA